MWKAVIFAQIVYSIKYSWLNSSVARKLFATNEFSFETTKK